MGARQRSLRYLEKLRLLHAVVTVVLTIGLLAWAIVLWQRGAATTGEVVLVCTLGLSVLHATRDLAVALVDVTQHMAPLVGGARHAPRAARAARSPGGGAAGPPRRQRRVRRRLVPLSRRTGSLRRISACSSSPASASAWSAARAAASRRCSPCCSDSTTCRHGRILIDGQDISRVTQESVREAISVVPQDISLFHRSVDGEHPLWPAGRDRRRGVGSGDRRQAATISSRPCPTASPPSSASGA